MDKLTDTITFKISPKLKAMFEEKALEKGMGVSELCRSWCIKMFHFSNFHMRDYLSNTDEVQDK